MITDSCRTPAETRSLARQGAALMRENRKDEVAVAAVGDMVLRGIASKSAGAAAEFAHIARQSAQVAEANVKDKALANQIRSTALALLAKGIGGAIGPALY